MVVSGRCRRGAGPRRPAAAPARSGRRGCARRPATAASPAASGCSRRATHSSSSAPSSRLHGAEPRQGGGTVELEPPRRRGQRAGGADRADELEVAEGQAGAMPGFLLAGNACGLSGSPGWPAGRADPDLPGDPDATGKETGDGRPFSELCNSGRRGPLRAGRGRCGGDVSPGSLGGAARRCAWGDAHRARPQAIRETMAAYVGLRPHMDMVTHIPRSPATSR